jgi:hypothetical protein
LDWGEQDFWERIPIDQLLFQYRMYSIPALQNHTNFLKDLVQWTFVNELLTLQPDGDLGPNRVVERPHIIYNSQTLTYVMWMHIDSSDYQEAKAGVATSAAICGDYSYQ